MYIIASTRHEKLPEPRAYSFFKFSNDWAMSRTTHGPVAPSNMHLQGVKDELDRRSAPTPPQPTVFQPDFLTTISSVHHSMRIVNVDKEHTYIRIIDSVICLFCHSDAFRNVEVIRLQ